MFDHTVNRCLRGCGLDPHSTAVRASLARRLDNFATRLRRARPDSISGLARICGGYSVGTAVATFGGDLRRTRKALGSFSREISTEEAKLRKSGVNGPLKPVDLSAQPKLEFLGEKLLAASESHFPRNIRRIVGDWKTLSSNEQLLAAWTIADWLKAKGVKTEAAALRSYRAQCPAGVLPSRFTLPRTTQTSRQRTKPNCIGRALLAASAFRAAGARCWYVTPLEAASVRLRILEGRAAQAILEIAKPLVRVGTAKWYQDLGVIARRGREMEQRPAWQHGCIVVELSDRRLVHVDPMVGSATDLSLNHEYRGALASLRRLQHVVPGALIQLVNQGNIDADAARWNAFKQSLRGVAELIPSVGGHGTLESFARLAATVDGTSDQSEQTQKRTRMQLAAKLLYELEGYAATAIASSRRGGFRDAISIREAKRMFLIRRLERAYKAFCKTDEQGKSVPRIFEVQQLEAGIAVAVVGHVSALSTSLRCRTLTNRVLVDASPGSFPLHNQLVMALSSRSPNSRTAAVVAAGALQMYPARMEATERVIVTLRDRKVIP